MRRSQSSKAVVDLNTTSYNSVNIFHAKYVIFKVKLTDKSYRRYQNDHEQRPSSCYKCDRHKLKGTQFQGGKSPNYYEFWVKIGALSLAFASSFRITRNGHFFMFIPELFGNQMLIPSISLRTPIFRAPLRTYKGHNIFNLSWSIST